jgi:hypothetical protein
MSVTFRNASIRNATIFSRIVNSLLWDIENSLRKLEEEYRFDGEFISLARQVYITNDKRADIKRKINEETNSSYKEIKLY